jgi:hypothetical protein
MNLKIESSPARNCELSYGGYFSRDDENVRNVPCNVGIIGVENLDEYEKKSGPFPTFLNRMMPLIHTSVPRRRVRA